MTPIEFGVSLSKVKVTVTFKLGGGDINVSQTFLVSMSVISPQSVHLTDFPGYLSKNYQFFCK